jgi:CBS domain containing-hemolysin-like protein
MNVESLLLLFLGLLAASALFSAIEIALFSISRARARRFAQEPGPVGATFRSLLAQPHSVLAQILLANTFANVAATATAAVLLNRAFDRFALPEWSTVLAATLGLTAVLLVVADLMPKTWAYEKSEIAAPTLARVFRLLSPMLSPLARGLESLAAWVARFGTGRQTEPLSADELETLVEVGTREGTLNLEESRLFRGAFRFGEKTAGEILVPRADVVMMDADTPLATALEQMADAPHARLPLYEGTIDRITGVLYAKDLIRYRLEPPGEGTVRAIQREPLLVSESRDLTGLLRAFQRERMHLAVVQDKDGRAIGIVTLEDVLAQIVGTMDDEFQEPEPACRPLGDGDAVFRGSVLVSEANRLLDLHLPGQPQETLAGLCARLATDGPSEGETFTVDGAKLAVEAVTGRRAWSVRVTRAEIAS